MAVKAQRKSFDSLTLAAGVAVPHYRGPGAAPYPTGGCLMVLLGFSGGVGRFVTS